MGFKHGEGTLDCLRREFREELNIDIRVRKHLYTTDFYQPSAFDPNLQVVGIYYRIETEEYRKINTSKIKYDFNEHIDGTHSFRWKKINELVDEDITFPIDKKVRELITRDF